MNAVEVARAALRGMGSNKMRSALTLLGVMIGVASVIALVGVGAGSQKAITDKINALGTTTLTVRAGGGGASGGIRFQNLTTEVADALSAASAAGPAGTAPDLAAVVPQVTSSQTVTAGTTTSTAQVIGTTADYFPVTGSTIAQGTGFSANDLATSRRVVVLGAGLAETLYGTDDAVGRTVVIGSTPYLVNGVMAAKDSTGLESTNDVLIAPLSRVQQAISGYGDLSSIVLQAASTDTVTAAQAEAAAIINATLKIDAADASYRITNQSQLLATASSTTSTFSAMLAAVAGISLLVGGIGVTNIMLVTVTERTREIGIRKALGATRGAVLGQFLTEATALTLLGGLTGVAVAFAVSHTEIMGVRPVILPGSVALAMGVCVVIGVFFGGYPAARAARMRPVDALRHE